jgi:hypothetical protein
MISLEAETPQGMTPSAGLRDGSKNAVERCVKTNYLAWHDLVEA